MEKKKYYICKRGEMRAKEIENTYFNNNFISYFMPYE